MLDPAAGAQVAEGLAPEPAPVDDGGVEVAGVNVVEGRGLKGPVRLGVGDDEAAVWRGPVAKERGRIRE